MLIEIERNFQPNKEQMDKLLKGAELVSEGTDVDVYYDFADYRLHKNKIHFRLRNNDFEMKMHIKERKESLVSVQQEYDMLNKNDTEFIKQTLQLTGDMPTEVLIKECIEKKILLPFNTITSHKKKYKKDGVNIVVNTTDTNYEITELECLAISEIEIDEAIAKIKDMAVSSCMGKEFEGEKVMGKFKENLLAKNSSLYNELYPKKENKELKLTRFEQLWGKIK